MIKYLLTAAILALVSPAHAQTPTPAQQQQALIATINQLTQQIVQQNVQIVVLQDELRAAQKPPEAAK